MRTLLPLQWAVKTAHILNAATHKGDGHKPENAEWG